MSKYSEIVGSFLRNGPFPLEADYIFSSEEELIQFYSEPENKAILHEGWFKIVGKGDKQALYWVVEEEDELKFVKLIERIDRSTIYEQLADLDTRLKKEVQDRLDADDEIWGNREEVVSDINNIELLSKAVDKLRTEMSKAINAISHIIKGDDSLNLDTFVSYLQTLDYPSIEALSKAVKKFLEAAGDLDDNINTLTEILHFLKGYAETDQLKTILEKLVADLMGLPLPSEEFRTLRGIEDFVRLLKSQSENTDANLQSELDRTQIGVGLSQDGSYSPDRETYYLKDATSVMNALKTLDRILHKYAHIEFHDTDTIDFDVLEIEEHPSRIVTANVKIAEDSDIIILGNNGLYHKVSLKENNGEITLYVNGEIRDSFNIGINPLLEDSYYDEHTEKLVLIFKLHNSQVQRVEIPADKLITEWEPENTSSINLSKERVIDGPDILTGNINLSKDSNNTLEIREDGVFTSYYIEVDKYVDDVEDVKDFIDPTVPYVTALHSSCKEINFINSNQDNYPIPYLLKYNVNNRGEINSIIIDFPKNRNVTFYDNMMIPIATLEDYNSGKIYKCFSPDRLSFFETDGSAYQFRFYDEEADLFGEDKEVKNSLDSGNYKLTIRGAFLEELGEDDDVEFESLLPVESLPPVESMVNIKGTPEVLLRLESGDSVEYYSDWEGKDKFVIKDNKGIFYRVLETDDLYYATESKLIKIDSDDAIYKAISNLDKNLNDKINQKIDNDTLEEKLEEFKEEIEELISTKSLIKENDSIISEVNILEADPIEFYTKPQVDDKFLSISDFFTIWPIMLENSGKVKALWKGNQVDYELAYPYSDNTIYIRYSNKDNSIDAVLLGEAFKYLKNGKNYLQGLYINGVTTETWTYKYADDPSLSLTVTIEADENGWFEYVFDKPLNYLSCDTLKNLLILTRYPILLGEVHLLSMFSGYAAKYPEKTAAVNLTNIPAECLSEATRITTRTGEFNKTTSLKHFNFQRIKELGPCIMEVLFQQSSIDNVVFPKSTSTYSNDMFNSAQTRRVDFRNLSVTGTFQKVFWNAGQLEEVLFGDNMTPSNISRLFYQSSIKNVDLSPINVNEITAIEYVFYGSSIETVKFPEDCNFEKVTTAQIMFSLARNLKSLDISNWKLPKCTTLQYFCSDSGIEEIKLPETELPELTTINAFIKGTPIRELVIPFTAPKLLDLSYMCLSCSSLEEVDISSLTSETITNIGYAFLSCVNLNKIKLNLDLSNCTSNSWCFYRCFNLETIEGSINNIKKSISFEYSHKLTEDSCMTIINGLSEVSSTQTLTLHKNAYDRLSEELIAVATAKGWSVVSANNTIPSEYQ